MLIPRSDPDDLNTVRCDPDDPTQFQRWHQSKIWENPCTHSLYMSM